MGLLFGYVENLFPIIPFPGLRIGLSNIVVLYSLFVLGLKYTLFLAIIKSILNGLLFSGTISIFYSLVSITFSVLIMYILKKLFYPEKVTEYGISVAGSVMFNICQILIASVLLKTNAVYYYMPFMILASVFTGLLIAFISKLTMRQIRGLK